MATSLLFNVYGPSLPVRSPDQIEFHAGDAQNSNGKLLPVCRRRVAKWPLTPNLAFSPTKGPGSVENDAADVKNPIGLLLPVWARHLEFC